MSLKALEAVESLRNRPYAAIIKVDKNNKAHIISFGQVDDLNEVKEHVYFLNEEAYREKDNCDFYFAMKQIR